jgi:hypothetical protein
MEKFGSGMEKSRIRYKHPGSATLVTGIVLSNKDGLKVVKLADPQLF